MTRIPIRFDTVWRWFLAALCIPVSQSYLEVDGPQVHVRMAWSFRATFPTPLLPFRVWIGVASGRPPGPSGRAGELVADVFQ